MASALGRRFLAGFQGLVLIALTAPAAAAAVPQPKARAAALDAIYACKDMPDAAARLACYDRAANALSQAEASGEVTVIDREQARTVRRQGFGLNLPSLGLFERGEQKDELDRLTVELAGARKGPDGRWLMETRDGAVWRQTDSEAFRVEPAAGQAMLVRKGALGGFFCKPGGEAAVRCIRNR